MKKICEVCTKEFNAIKRKTRFCSWSCKCIGHSLDMAGHPPFHWKGGRIQNKGYIYVLAKDHPAADRDGYVMEHRLVMEKHLGRHLQDGEEVHHKNKKHGDNRFENLVLTKSHSEHMKMHYPKGRTFSLGPL